MTDVNTWRYSERGHFQKKPLRSTSNSSVGCANRTSILPKKRLAQASWDFRRPPFGKSRGFAAESRDFVGKAGIFAHHSGWLRIGPVAPGLRSASLRSVPPPPDQSSATLHSRKSQLSRQNPCFPRQTPNFPKLRPRNPSLPLKRLSDPRRGSWLKTGENTPKLAKTEQGDLLSK